MTNEQLAQLIQGGNADELTPILWENVKPLLYMMSTRAYNARTEHFNQCGIELLDIKQSCYSVMLEGIRAYKPADNLKFITFLNYPFKNMCNKLAGMRTAGSRNEPLNNKYISLDKPIEQSDNDNCTLSDIIPDNSIQDIDERIQNNILKTVIASTLTAEQQKIIYLIYWCNLNESVVARQLNMPYAYVRKEHYHALKNLRTCLNNLI